MNKKTAKDLSLIAVMAILINFLVWLPHLLSLPNLWGLNFKEGFNTIYRNFDGIEYIIIAKSWYFPNLIAQLPQTQPAGYFASHFPGYSALIYLFSPFLGFLKSMLLLSLLFTILSAFIFYLLVRDFKLTKEPLFLSLVFLVLPARWLIVHSVGSSEPMFIFSVVASLYFFLKYEQGQFSHLHLKEPIYNSKLLYLSAFFGLIAQLTRPPGILLFLAYLLYILLKVIRSKSATKIRLSNYLPLLAIPFGLLVVFLLFDRTYGDFWAYFHSGDNIHLTFPPFQVFNKSQFWVGDIWLEDIIYIFILAFLGAISLLRQKMDVLAVFVLTYLAASTIVVHRDVSRYLLPVFPFVLIAFEKVLTSKEFKIVLLIVSLAIYLYSQNFILANTAPYPNPQLFN